MTAVVGVEYLPVLEVRDDSLDGCAERGEGGIVFFVALARLSSFRFLSRRGEAGSLVAFVADSAAGVADDLVDRCLVERRLVVRVSGQWFGDEDRGSIQQTDQFRLEALWWRVFDSTAPCGRCRTSTA